MAVRRSFFALEILDQHWLSLFERKNHLFSPKRCRCLRRHRNHFVKNVINHARVPNVDAVTGLPAKSGCVSFERNFSQNCQHFLNHEESLSRISVFLFEVGVESIGGLLAACGSAGFGASESFRCGRTNELSLQTPEDCLFSGQIR